MPYHMHQHASLHAPENHHEALAKAIVDQCGQNPAVKCIIVLSFSYVYKRFGCVINFYSPPTWNPSSSISFPSSPLFLLPSCLYPDQVSCGNHHSLMLTSSGVVYGWGSNMNGQLGLLHSGEVVRTSYIIM